MRKIRTTVLGPFLLVLVSLLWGTSFPLIKIVVSKINAGEYVAFRFSLSVMLLMPYLFYSLLRNKARLREAVKPGVILGIYSIPEEFFYKDLEQDILLHLTQASSQAFTYL